MNVSRSVVLGREEIIEASLCEMWILWPPMRGKRGMLYLLDIYQRQKVPAVPVNDCRRLFPWAAGGGAAVVRAFKSFLPPPPNPSWPFPPNTCP